MTPVTLEVVRRRLTAHSPDRVIDPSAVEAAVALVLAPTGRGGLDALLIERATRPEDPWSGQVAFPGGRRDPADASLLDTAIREVSEEVGVRLRETDLLGELDDVHPRTKTLPSIVVRPFVFGLHSQPSIRHSEEVASHYWASLDELMTPGVYGDVEIQLVQRTFPAYRLGHLIVWGMTERIITPFLHLAIEDPTND